MKGRLLSRNLRNRIKQHRRVLHDYSRWSLFLAGSVLRARRGVQDWRYSHTGKDYMIGFFYDRSELGS